MQAQTAWLLEIGAGTNLDEAGTVQVPDNMCCSPNTRDKLINDTYPDIHLGNKPNQYFLERTILCCKNDDVDDINKIILDMMPGIEKVLNSADSIDLANEAQDGYQPYPMEYLNSLNVLTVVCLWPNWH
jgi:hypothetical protein